jgi:hypothetical protein
VRLPALASGILAEPGSASTDVVAVVIGDLQLDDNRNSGQSGGPFWRSTEPVRPNPCQLQSQNGTKRKSGHPKKLPTEQRQMGGTITMCLILGHFCPFPQVDRQPLHVAFWHSTPFFIRCAVSFRCFRFGFRARGSRFSTTKQDQHDRCTAIELPPWFYNSVRSSH